uniref:Uncharacterized protein n=1 Tax=Ficedula albicollis TaxID=59894 RepID=A0A803V6G3_FICAL
LGFSHPSPPRSSSTDCTGTGGGGQANCSSAAAAAASAPAGRSLSSGSASCKLSASTTCSVAVADSAGCPWSFTTATTRCLAASRSDTARAVRTSPLCSPTRNSAGSDACTSSYDSHALRPASASTATTLATR